jgi:uncharacterized repeat protein (TIGR01451 family)
VTQGEQVRKKEAERRISDTYLTPNIDTIRIDEEKTMGRLTSNGIRTLAVAVALLLALGLTQRSALAAAAIQVTPTSGAANSVAQLSGAGYAATTNVNVYFAGNLLGTTGTDASGNFTVNFNVPNMSPGNYTVTASSATQSASTTFTITPAAVGLHATKTVTVNGLGYGATANAHPGDQLTYQIVVQNTTTSAISGVTVADTLAAGQTAFTTTSACTYSGATNTVTCTMGSALAAGTSTVFFFTTIVNPGFSGNIPNTASVSGTGFAATNSNQTVVTVYPAIIVTAPLQFCGIVTAYTAPNASAATAGSVTVSGIMVAIAPSASISGTPITVGANLCLNFSTNGTGQIAAVTVTSNLTGLGLACGAYAPGSTSTNISIGGLIVPLVPGITVTSTAAAGGYFCFLVNSSGQVYGVLSTTPTSVTFPHAGHAAGARGAARPE